MTQRLAARRGSRGLSTARPQGRTSSRRGDAKFIARFQGSQVGVCRTSQDPLQDLTDMKSLPDAELESLTTTPGPRQYLAFDEMARRVRDNPSRWTRQQEPWAWSAVDWTRGAECQPMRSGHF